MEKYVCTWLCADEKGEESTYAQMKGIGSSSSSKFLNIYWKNISVFFLTCRKFNQNINFILFANIDTPESIDGINYKEVLSILGVEIIQVQFNYKTPINYYGAWRNQFFEFSIFEKIIEKDQNDQNQYLLLDSDCVFTGPLTSLWNKASENGFLCYKMDYDEHKIINGLSRFEMKLIYEELLGASLNSAPAYYGGEFFLASINIIKLINKDFVELWPSLLQRNMDGKKKFNEEAQTLSYIYFKNKIDFLYGNDFIKRLWTQPFIHRNVQNGDENKLVWHLPHEKKYGMLKLFKVLLKDINKTLLMPNVLFTKLLRYYLTVPSIPYWIYVSRIIPIQIGKQILKLVKK